MPFKTAILQMRSRNRDIQNNISIVIDRMKEAKSNHADILLLPECFITGYDLTIGNDDALTEDDLKQLCEKAKELHIGVVATAIARGTAKPQNAAFVSELIVITKAKELCSYVMTVTQKSPKHFRFTFVTRMQNLSLDVIENLYRANDTFVSGRDREAVKERLGYQHKAITSLKLLA